MKWCMFPIIGSFHGPGDNLDFLIAEFFNAMMVKKKMASGIRKQGFWSSIKAGNDNRCTEWEMSWVTLSCMPVSSIYTLYQGTGNYLHMFSISFLLSFPFIVESKVGFSVSFVCGILSRSSNGSFPSLLFASQQTKSQED